MTYALLIDDDSGIRDSFERLVNQSELDLLLASTWDEGLSLFQLHLPMLVIADYNLPGSKHGLRLLSEIRRLTPAVRLLLLSGYIGEEDVAEIEGIGLVDRAIPKTRDGLGAELLHEIELARARGSQATDWKAYAEAHRRSREVDQSQIDALDLKLKQTRGIS